MRIEYAIPCRYAEVGIDGSATIVGAGIDALAVEGSLPQQVATFVLLRVLGTEQELAGSHRWGFEVAAPSGEIVGRYEELTALAPALSDVDRPGPEWLQGVMVPGGIQFLATTLGPHRLTLRFDDLTHDTVLYVA